MSLICSLFSEANIIRTYPIRTSTVCAFIPRSNITKFLMILLCQIAYFYYAKVHRHHDILVRHSKGDPFKSLSSPCPKSYVYLRVTYVGSQAFPSYKSFLLSFQKATHPYKNAVLSFNLRFRPVHFRSIGTLHFSCAKPRIHVAIAV